MIQYIKNNLYLGKYHYFTDEEIEFGDQLEKEWRASQKRFTTKELFEIFPQAPTIYKRNLKEKIQQIKEQLIALALFKRNFLAKLSKVQPRDRWFYEAWADVFYLDNILKLQRELKNLTFKISTLDKPTNSRGFTPAQIEQAKSVKFEDIFPERLRMVGGKLMGRCPFHQDKTPSFTIYPDQNSFYCYSCNKGGDIIKYVELKEQCSFVQAIKYLLSH